MSGEYEKAQDFWNLLFENWVVQERRIRNCLPDQPNSEKAKLYRGWWQSASELLWFMTRQKAQNNWSFEPQPVELLARLANMAEDLGQGNISEFFSLVASGGGRNPRWATERRDIAAAVVYILAVRAGDIIDLNPVKTVSEAFGVTRQAVQKWLKEQEELLIGVPKLEQDASAIECSMRTCGERYKWLGRSSTAIRRRGKKNKIY